MMMTANCRYMCLKELKGKVLNMTNKERRKAIKTIKFGLVIELAIVGAIAMLQTLTTFKVFLLTVCVFITFLVQMWEVLSK